MKGRPLQSVLKGPMQQIMTYDCTVVGTGGKQCCG